MRSKAPLALIEQTVMLLVFALASALCLQAFVKSDRISLRIEARSSAVLVSQDAAELIRHSGGNVDHALARAGELLGGDYTQGVLRVGYDEDWNPTGDAAVYRLTAQGVPAEEPGLRRVRIQVTAEEAENMALLFELEVAWLEVSQDE